MLAFQSEISLCDADEYDDVFVPGSGGMSRRRSRNGVRRKDVKAERPNINTPFMKSLQNY